MPSTASVSILSVIFMSVSAAICFGLPIGLALWGKKRFGKEFSLLPMLAGVIAFIVSQMILRIPLMAWLEYCAKNQVPGFDWYLQFMKMPWLYATVACFTAGLFEEPARFIAFSVMKRRRNYLDGLSYGIGHGGVEAVALVGINMLFSAGALVIDRIWSTNLFPAEQAQAVVAIPQIVFLTGGIERIFAITVHIGLSLFVLRGFQTGKRWLYLLCAILLHGLTNFLTVVLLPLLGIRNPVWIEVGIGLEAAVALWYIIVCAKRWSARNGLHNAAAAEGERTVE